MGARGRPPDVSLAFGPEADAPRQARWAVRPLFPDGDDPISAAVTLAVSELVTNVIKHTNAGGTLRAWDPKPDAPFRVEVEDSDPTPPRRMAPDPHEPTGRGVQLVESLADSWGVEALPSGKVVWAEFNRHPRIVR